MFDCTCNVQNSLLLKQHNGDDPPQDEKKISKVQPRIANESPKGAVEVTFPTLF